MHAALEELQGGFDKDLAGLTSAQTQHRTDDDAARWSIQQIVEHLIMTYALTVRVFEDRLAKGTPTKAKPNLAQRIGQFVVLRLGRFPKGREAPPMVVPPNAPEPLSGEQLMERITALLARLDLLIRNAEKCFGSSRAISHQVLGPISVAQWCRFHLVHGQHHLKQVRAIRLASRPSGD